MIKKEKIIICIFLVVSLLVTGVNALDLYTSNNFQSTSVVKTQYFSTNINNPYNTEYSFLYSTPTIQQKENYFDLMIAIPPGGCTPDVVRSDLLEEQNVPVFCQLMAVKVNPGVDISRIDRIVTSSNSENQYISGIGFHPARAAIKSTGRLISTPIDMNIGYVVIVLKQIPTEKQMPDFVEVNLSAYLLYNSEFGFGIGQTEFYVPQLSDVEFESNYEDYGFLKGQAFLRVEDMDSKSAVISIYNSAKDKVYGSRLEKGKSYDDIFLPSIYGGQGIKVTLEDITVPETRARIIVGSNIYDVYEGQKFADGQCTLTKAEAQGGGTGYVNINCGGNTVTLTKDFGKIQLKVGTGTGEYSVGDTIYVNTYLVYLGVIPDTFANQENKAYAVLAKSTKALTKDDIVSIRNSLSAKISSIKATTLKDYKSQLEKLSYSGAEFKVVYSGAGEVKWDKNSNLQVSFDGTKYENLKLADETRKYYDETVTGYDNVIERFGNENFNGQDNTDYAVQALCAKYILASDLKQNLDAREFLLDLSKDYPDAVCNGKSITSILNEQEIVSSENARSYVESQNLELELVSVDEPAKQDASVDFEYLPIRTNKLKPETENKHNLRKGESISDLGDGRQTKITLVSFDENEATLSYSCLKQIGRTKRISEIKKTTTNKVLELDECDGRVIVDNIYLKKIAKVSVIPETKGRSLTSNFSVKIGIEKRAIQLSPEQASEKIENLNKTIESWTKANENLGKIVEGGKAACLVTAGALTIKNYLSGLSGEAAARNKVMTMEGGWNQICEQNYQKLDYSSVDACISGKSKEIEASVTAMQKAMKAYNDAEEAIVSTNTQAGKGILGQDKIDYAKIRQGELNAVKGLGTVKLIDQNGKSVPFDFSKGLEKVDVEKDGISSSDLRELEVDIKTAQNPDVPEEFRKALLKKSNLILNNIYSAGENRRAREQSASSLGINAVDMHIIANRQTTKEDYTQLLWSKVSGNFDSISGINANDKVAYITTPGSSVNYLAVLQGDKQLSVKQIYNITGKTLTKLDTSKDNNARNAANVIFNLVDENSYHNRCENCNEAKFYNSGSYKGLPQLIPFDKDNGWYVATENLLPLLGEAKTYQDSGRVNSFYICNIDGNKRIDEVGISDDICRRFDLYTGDTLSDFPGLTKDQTKVLVSKAIKALEDASRQAANNPSSITINGMVLKVVGTSGSTGTRCSDFMSAEDCKILFNVCDPFVCPNSRCDLGGEYHVDDVIQSGIIGSIVLCLPNFVGFGGDVYVPVCLTGIHAGIEGWISILEAHKACLQENIKTGKLVGICDEIYSIYQCDFFWRQLAPFMSAVLKGLLSGTFLGGTKGGGEYMFANAAFTNAENSWKYFTNSYASESKLAFGVKSFTEIGTEICKQRFGVTYPDNFGSVLSPESPTQFTAWFDEMTYSDATVPSTSQYKVFYHIYSGADQGVYYVVYLKSPTTTLGYVGTPQYVVASGFTGKGETASETKDFIATSGFKELCVRINAEEKCGFKQVSTSFALNYAKDEIVADQAKQQITSETECIAGTPSVGSLLNPNIQAGAEEVVSPELYNRGVIRVCSTNNPGETSDPTRWQEVGVCSGNMKCWIDVYSVKNAIQGKGIENKTLSAIDNMGKQALVSEGYLDEPEGENAIGTLKEKYNKLLKIFEQGKPKTAPSWIDNFDEDVNGNYSILIYNHQKADIFYYKAEVYANITRNLQKNLGFYQTVTAIPTTTPQPTKPAEREKWTLDSALTKVNEIISSGRGATKYSQNKEFIDQLYVDKVITSKEYDEINGGTSWDLGIWNGEENMAYVRELLLQKKAQQERGKVRKRQLE